MLFSAYFSLSLIDTGWLIFAQFSTVYRRRGTRGEITPRTHLRTHAHHILPRTRCLSRARTHKHYAPAALLLRTHTHTHTHLRWFPTHTFTCTHLFYYLHTRSHTTPHFIPVPLPYTRGYSVDTRLLHTHHPYPHPPPHPHAHTHTRAHAHHAPRRCPTCTHPHPAPLYTLPHFCARHTRYLTHTATHATCTPLHTHALLRFTHL